MKEEIIIDGVNVAGCDRHCSDNHNIPNRCYSDINESYRDCKPKEYQCNFYVTRLEQENKELKEKIKNKPLQCLLYNDKQNKCALFAKTVAYHCALEEIKGYFLNPNSNLELQTRQAMLIKINEVLNED